MTESLFSIRRIGLLMYPKFIYRLSILMVICIFVVSLNGRDIAAASFSDIPTAYKNEIGFLIDKNVINGYPDQTFRPQNSVTREEAVTMVGRALGLNGTQRNTSYQDVNRTDYSSGYIQSALEKQIISVGTDKKFRPRDKMTRGEMAYLLQKAFKLKEKSLLVSISDVSAKGSLYDAINSIVTAGLSNGYPDGTFKPNNSMTRTEFSLFVARGINSDYRVDNDIEPINELKPIGEKLTNATWLNVRTTPSSSTDLNISSGFPAKTVVTVYRYEGNWALVSSGDTYGYVHNGYLINPGDETEPEEETPTPPATAKRIIAIDAGHGDHDPGAIENGLQEKDVNLAVSLKVEKLLKEKGFTVVMTRRDDTFLELAERVAVAQAKNADTFVSIHSNTFSNSSANGTETYFSSAAVDPNAEKSKKLATFIQERLYKALDTYNRGVKDSGFYVIKYNPVPSALVELGFISNSSDAQKLASEEYRNKAAEAIASGIVDYYNWRD